MLFTYKIKKELGSRWKLIRIEILFLDVVYKKSYEIEILFTYILVI